MQSTINGQRVQVFRPREQLPKKGLLGREHKELLVSEVCRKGHEHILHQDVAPEQLAVTLGDNPTLATNGKVEHVPADLTSPDPEVKTADHAAKPRHPAKELITVVHEKRGEHTTGKQTSS